MLFKNTDEALERFEDQAIDLRRKVEMVRHAVKEGESIRAISIALTKLDEAALWLGQARRIESREG